MKHVIAAFLAFVLVACSSHGSSQSAPGQKHNSNSTSSTVPNVTTTTLSGAAIAANKQAMHDVAITSCAANAAQRLEIKGTARNTSASRADFVVLLAIRDKTGIMRYATSASANKVAPSHIAQWDAVTTANYESGMTCTVTSVSRTASS